MYCPLDLAGEQRRIFVEIAQVDVDLVDPAILDFRRDRGHRCLETLRVVTIRIEIGREQNRLRRLACALHEPHAGEHPSRPRLVGRGRHDTTPDIVAQSRKNPGTIGLPDGLVSAASADDHGLTSELGIAQQFDRGVKSIHVEMCDAALAVHRPLDSRTNGKSAKGQATTGRWLTPPACRPL